MKRISAVAGGAPPNNASLDASGTSGSLIDN